MILQDRGECPFCLRVERKEFELTNNYSIVRFKPLNPITEGHMLFIPRQHSVFPGSLKDAMWEASVYGTFNQEEFNLITSYGSNATQSIPHVHLHYIPRREEDGLALPWTGQRR